MERVADDPWRDPAALLNNLPAGGNVRTFVLLLSGQEVKVHGDV